MNLYYVRSKL